MPAAACPPLRRRHPAAAVAAGLPVSRLRLPNTMPSRRFYRQLSPLPAFGLIPATTAAAVAGSWLAPPLLAGH